MCATDRWFPHGVPRVGLRWREVSDLTGGKVTQRFGIFGRAIAVTVTAGVALSLTGCGDTQNSGPGYASKDDIVKVGDAPLARSEIMSAAYDAAVKSGSAHLTMTMKGAMSTGAQGDVTYADGKSAMKMTMSMPQLGKGKIEVRYVGELLYMTIPGVTPAGKFVAIDPNDQSSPLAKSFSGLTDQLDPLRSVKTMESAVTKAPRVGQTTLDGVPVDHYRVTVDTTKVMKDLGQKAPPAAQLPKTLTYDMWLDDKDLIRKMTFAIARTSVMMRMSKWGQNVKVERPATKDILKGPGA
jgi:lipoprotein LprG